MEQGQIVKILSDTHFVNWNGNLFECKCRGKFRNARVTPLVGDYVEFDKEKQVIEKILPRRNAFDRPLVSNIDQAFLITSVKHPDFSTNLLDKLLVVMELHHVRPIICLTKLDLLTRSERKEMKKIMHYYRKLGYRVLTNRNLWQIKMLFRHKTSVFTGQTGAGKSSLLNRLNSKLQLETGEISLALGRGKHTTRHVELLELFGGKVLDTPGFSSLEFKNYSKEQIRDAFVEFRKFPCDFKDCMHLKERHCGVKDALDSGYILPSRYENYVKILKESR